jgi:hypothetical protein
MLVGADGSITDESSVARSLTNTSVDVGAAVIAESTGSLLFNHVNDALSTADAADITVGSGDMTIELWYQGNGSAPSNGVEYVWFGKFATNNREWVINYLSNNIQIFASSNGSSWTNSIVLAMSDTEKHTFFNGAPRHLAYVKNGSEWALYVNGMKRSTTLTIATAFNGNAVMTVGSAAVAPIGKCDEFRATFGTARYTGGMVTLDGRKFPRS